MCSVVVCKQTLTSPKEKKPNIFSILKKAPRCFFVLVFLYIYNIEMPPGLTKQMLPQIPAAASFLSFILLLLQCFFSFFFKQSLPAFVNAASRGHKPLFFLCPRPSRETLD